VQNCPAHPSVVVVVVVVVAVVLVVVVVVEVVCVVVVVVTVVDVVYTSKSVGQLPLINATQKPVASFRHGPDVPNLHPPSGHARAVVVLVVTGATVGFVVVGAEPSSHSENEAGHWPSSLKSVHTTVLAPVAL
jgi:hypothetical protein